MMALELTGNSLPDHRATGRIEQSHARAEALGAGTTNRGNRPLRIALLSYRSKPHSGGQGIYIRHLSRELAARGHDVEVLSGPPLPDLDDGVRLTAVPSLDLYREPDPFRVPNWREFRSPIDVLEFGLMCTAAFPEPLTFSLRARKLLKSRPVSDRPDIVHDNQTLGYGMLLLARDGFPVVATLHHPITVDRRLDLLATPLHQQLPKRRWYSFLRMQKRVVQRMPAVLTVSESSAADIVDDFGVARHNLTVIPVGVETDVFVPPTAPRVPGRIVTTASSDVPLKGLVPLLEAMAKLRTENDVELVVVGTIREGGAAHEAIHRLGLDGAVRFVNGLSEPDLVALLSSAQVAVVPSLYEGFSLPAIEAMSCSTPLVATTAGALPEVVGGDGEAALLVAPDDSDALKSAIARVLGDPSLARRLGQAGRKRAIARYSWPAIAERTEAWYRAHLNARLDGGNGC